MSLLMDWGSMLFDALLELGNFLSYEVEIAGYSYGTVGDVLLTGGLGLALSWKITKFFTGI